ncbi:MAG TPA: DinB family protein [Nocardioidaceae bacterium]|nr:DinB family protein [Nocardioidaceae bacterium]
MSTATDLLVDAFGRVRENVHAAVQGLTEDQLALRPDEQANSIAWLVWHLTRVQDSHVAEVAERNQVWHADGWADRFGLPFDAGATGYGQSSDEVGAVRASADLLADYHDATHAQTVAYLGSLTDEDLAAVVDERWDPPVTLAVRLVSVVDDDTQHVGQAAYVRGLFADP